MRRRPRSDNELSISNTSPLKAREVKTGLVLSGGGSRAAYQVGALRALLPLLKDTPHPFNVILGSSIGSINGLIAAASIKQGLSTTIEELENLWRERNFRNTFAGSPSTAFFRAIRLAVTQYLAPGPHASSNAVFDPSPLMARIDSAINSYGGLSPEQRDPALESVGVMTTLEGTERKPLLFLSTHKSLDPQILDGASFEICRVESLSAKHGFASAALPAVLPPVELDTEGGKMRLVDGGISINVPVDPAVRLGAERVIVIDVSGRDWWLRHYGEAGDTRPTWEVPSALKTFCLRPPETFVTRPVKPLGPLLRDAVKSSRGKFIASLGPVWPVFSLLKNKQGEDVAYEAMTYVALDPDYLQGLMERGHDETRHLLKNRTHLEYARSESYEKWAETL